ncbi:MAG: 6,7-dimethyl-8-ribityllumazine synthase [Flavobacteriaceae bacterium]|tara:strand:- start:13767 stop:14255 length:489 start_codon:yes stop_codon:yes gene_type:complete
MSYSGFNTPQKEDKKTISSRKKYKISIIVSDWNKQITSKLLKGAVETLTHQGILNENIFITQVPGSFELIFEAKKKSKDSIFDSIIVIGCLIKGETKHFKYLCKSVSYSIAKINLKSSIPVIFCVLMDENIKQSIERSGGRIGNKGVDAAYTSLKMMELNKS